jgi:hypothetical protein
VCVFLCGCVGVVYSILMSSLPTSTNQRDDRNNGDIDAGVCGRNHQDADPLLETDAHTETVPLRSVGWWCRVYKT